MNLMLSTTAVSTWRCIKLQHAALVCGLVLAASAAIAIGAGEETSTPPAVRNRLQSVVAKPRTPASPLLFHIYLFGSQLDADLFRSGVLLQAGFTTVVVDTPESEALARSMALELMYYTPDTRIVDMRGHMGGDVYLGPGSEYYSESYAPLRPVLP